jgi:hypothetical protein
MFLIAWAVRSPWRTPSFAKGWDKGISLLNNNLTITRSQIIDCDKGIAFKNSSLGATRNTSVSQCTIVSEEHDTNTAPWGYSIPPSAGDPDTPSTALWTQWKTAGGGGTPTQDGTMNMQVTNCILFAKLPIQVDNGPGQYTNATTSATYTCTYDVDQPATPARPGTGNINSDPLFVGAATKDFRLQATSPCRDTGDPSAPSDPDGSRADMGALPFAVPVAPNTVVWAPAGGPYHVTANAIVPAGTKLTIQPGTLVYFDQNRRLTVNGRIQALGLASAHITFSHVPGTVAPGDCDPIKNGTQTGPPKWGGLRIIDSLAEENTVSYCDFINAQGTSPVDLLESDQENWGALGAIRSWVWVDHCSWTGRICAGAMDAARSSRSPAVTSRTCSMPPKRPRRTSSSVRITNRSRSRSNIKRRTQRCRTTRISSMGFR